MTLTSQLRDPSSPLARLFAAELPDPDALLRSYRSALPERPATVRPRIPSGEQPPWATIGTAIDLRLRLALTSDPSQDEALPRGVALSARLTDAADPGGPPAATAADVEAVGWALLDLLDLLDELTAAYMPCARSRPVPLSPAAEARLCRAVYLAAEYVEVYRSGRPGLVLADAGDDGPITLATLLAAVPRYVVEDLTAMVTRADTGLSRVRAAVSPGDVIPGPTFAGSDAAGHADGDWIARGLLVDVKATVHPDRLGELEAYQLAGYALLDWDDRHRIDRVGWYLARQGLLPVWGLDEYVTLLGARRTAADLRRIAAVLRPLPASKASAGARGAGAQPARARPVAQRGRLRGATPADLCDREGTRARRRRASAGLGPDDDAASSQTRYDVVHAVRSTAPYPPTNGQWVRKSTVSPQFSAHSGPDLHNRRHDTTVWGAAPVHRRRRPRRDRCSAVRPLSGLAHERSQ